MSLRFLFRESKENVGNVTSIFTWQRWEFFLINNGLLVQAFKTLGRWRICGPSKDIKVFLSYVQTQSFQCGSWSQKLGKLANFIHPKFAIEGTLRGSLLLCLSNCETWHKLSKQPSFICHFLLLNHLLLHQLGNIKRIRLWMLSLYERNLSTKSFSGAEPLIIRLLQNFHAALGNRN